MEYRYRTSHVKGDGMEEGWRGSVMNNYRWEGTWGVRDGMEKIVKGKKEFVE